MSNCCCARLEEGKPALPYYKSSNLSLSVKRSAVVVRLPARPAFGAIVASLGGSSACLSDSGGALGESGASGRGKGSRDTSSCTALAIGCLSVDIGSRGEVINLSCSQIR